MKLALLPLLVVLCACVTTGGVAAKQSAARPAAGNLAVMDEARVALERYLRVEEQRRFTDIYKMLSAARRRMLRERGYAADAKQYRAFRRDSEAAWSDFVIEGRTDDGADRVIFTGRARVVETGEAENVKFRCVMVRQGNRWLLDAWEY